MRKTILFACAAVLTSAVALTSCKKEGQNEPKKPAEVVKTEFAISLPNQLTNGVKRMPGTTVQTSPAQFQGMANLKLIPFATTATDKSAASRLGDANISLEDIAIGALTETGNAKLYSSVDIPLTTASFLFYAQSAKTGTDHEIGALVADGIAAGAPAGITFTPKPIVTTTIADVTGVGTVGKSLIDYLNSVANANDGAGTPKAWKNYTPADDAVMAGFFALYSQNHALSSFEVARLMSDLYTQVSQASASTLKTNVLAAINNTDDYVKSLTGTGTELDPYVIELKDDLKTFPATEAGLPDGAVRIKYNSLAGEFQACDASEYTAANQIPLDKYVYPASLWYYANSTLKAANESKSALYTNSNSWSTILTGYGECPTTVNSLTRSVALVDPIQYAVARLDVIVKLNATELPDQSTQNIACSSYPVTAVLVGNQRTVGYNFEPTTSDIYTIYDNVMTTSPLNATTTNTAANSTLVLETTGGGSAANDDVKVAIELTNNSGKDFKGANGEIIPKNGKFYLVATLSAAEASETGGKVFKQDYTTTATLTITSLANAYNTIPDLRSPKLEFGMSVDLTWQVGHSYSINL